MDRGFAPQLDALSQTLRVVQLSGAIFVNGRFTAPWCYQSPAAATAAPYLEPNAERVVIFHLVTEGECVAELGNLPPLKVKAGEAVLFPQGDAHRMGSAPGLVPATPGNLAELLSRRPGSIVYGGGGARTRMVCGYMACDARLAALLLDGLPPLVRVALRGSGAGDWIEASLRYALAEARSPRPGGEGMLAKLAELIFIEVLRRYILQADDGDSLAAGRRGWLAGVGDRLVGAALKSIHQEPARPWTVEELAAAAGTSRSVLAERFQQLVGRGPIQYLTEWRMILAANLLRQGSQPLAQIAEDVGYQTDTAFSRAFRRAYGAPPAAWRRRQVGGGVSGQLS